MKNYTATNYTALKKNVKTATTINQLDKAEKKAFDVLTANQYEDFCNMINNRINFLVQRK